MIIKTIIEGHDTRAGKSFDLFIQFLIIISIISFSIETLPDLNDKTRLILRYTEIIIVLIFTAEYISRVIVSDNRFGYIFSFFGLVDLFAILPFYISAGVDLRAIRAIRLLRLLRVLKLVRYNKAIQRFHKAFLIAKEELVLFLFATIILFYLSSVGIYYFEHSAQPEVFTSIFHSMWWSVATLTTVGYGDVYPITIGGKIFTFIVLMIGLGVVAVPAGLVASALQKARSEEDLTD